MSCLFESIIITLVGVVCFLLGGCFVPKLQKMWDRLALFRLARRFSGNIILSDEPDAWYSQAPVLWAHAGGGKYHAYGNTKEDVAGSIAQGFSVIEVDVELTSDAVPVLSHRFRPGNRVVFDHRPSLKEFLSMPIDGKFTPLTLDALFSTFKEYKGCFALDSWGVFRSGIEFNLVEYLLNRLDRETQKRIIYLANTLQEGIEVARLNRFASVHYGLPDSIDKNNGVWRLPSFARILAGAGIHSVSLMDREISVITRKVVEVMRQKGVHMSICGVETVERCKKWIEVGADCFNTDVLSPHQMRLE